MKYSVLVCDDLITEAELIVSLCRLAVEELGHQFHGEYVTRGIDAIIKVARKKYDAIIVDLILQGEYTDKTPLGLTVGQTIRERVGPGAKLIAISAKHSESLESSCTKAGFDYFIQWFS